MKRLLPTIALLGLIGACSPAPETGEATAADVVAEPVTGVAPVATVDPMADATPKAGEDYWTIRPRLVAAGFTPVDTNDEDFTVCTEGMVEKRYISPRECASPVDILPEVNSCAGTGEGTCLIHWRAPNERFLTIYTVDGPQPGVVQSVEWSDTRPAFEE
jgi:hypothetical protein